MGYKKWSLNKQKREGTEEAIIVNSVILNATVYWVFSWGSYNFILNPQALQFTTYKQKHGIHSFGNSTVT